MSRVQAAIVTTYRNQLREAEANLHRLRVHWADPGYEFEDAIACDCHECDPRFSGSLTEADLSTCEHGRYDLCRDCDAECTPETDR